MESETIRITGGRGGMYTTETGKRLRLSKAAIAEGPYELVDSFDDFDPVGTPDVTLQGASETITTQDVDNRIAELETELGDTKAELEEALAQVDKLTPVVDVTYFMFDTPEEVVAHFGEKEIDKKVRHQLAIENKRMMKEGHARMEITPEYFAEAKAEFLEAFVADRETVRPPSEGWLTRMIKLYDPKRDMVIQVIYEGQVNNVAGSLADGYVRYTNKGYKLTDPVICPSKDCWKKGVVADGEFVFHGYCSEDHYNRTEKGRTNAPAVLV